MRTTRSDLDSQGQSESWVEPGIRSRSEALVSSLTIQLTRRCKRWEPLALGRRYGARRSPFSKYMSLHLSLKLTTNCVPLSRIKWERYIFIKKYVSFRSLKFVPDLWWCSWLGLWEEYNNLTQGNFRAKLIWVVTKKQFDPVSTKCTLISL